MGNPFRSLAMLTTATCGLALATPVRAVPTVPMERPGVLVEMESGEGHSRTQQMPSLAFGTAPTSPPSSVDSSTRQLMGGVILKSHYTTQWIGDTFNGAGMDTKGNLYVVMSRSETVIRALSPAGGMLWTVPLHLDPARTLIKK